MADEYMEMEGEREYPEKEKPPKGVRTADDRKQLASKLVRLVELGEQERGTLKPRWDVNRANYDGDKPNFSNRFLPGAEPNFFPLVKPKGRALAANVLGTIFAQSPTVLAELQGAPVDTAAGLERQIEYFLDIGGLRRTLEAAEGLAFVTNNCVIRTTLEASARGFAPRDHGDYTQKGGPISYCGPVWDVIDPEDFVCYPKSAGSIPKSQIVGHRFWRQMWEIRELQKAEVYIDDDHSILTSVPEQEAEAVRASDVESSEIDEQLVECWELLFKDDLDDLGYRRWYKAVVARETEVLLKIEEYLPSRPWYTFMRYTPSEPNSCWSEGSLAQDLQGLQWEKNNIRNLIVYGSFMAAFPPIGGTPRAPKEKAMRYGPNTIIGDPNASAISIRFDPGKLENELERIERDADSIIGIGQAGTGAQFRSGTTATEAAYVQASQQTGVKQFLATFGRGVVEIVEILAELLELEWDVWTELHPLYTEREAMQAPVRWQLHGSSPEMLPNVLLEKYRFLLEHVLMEQNAASKSGQPYQPRFDMDELWRSLLNQLQIPNREKIMANQPQQQMAQMEQLAQMGQMGGVDGRLGGLLQESGMADSEAQISF